MSSMRVAIAGAGIGGLTLGLALRKRGIDVDVYEQAETLGEIGAGIGLAGNASRLLRGLGIGDELAKVAEQVPTLDFRRWKDGAVVASHPFDDRYEERYGAPVYLLSRPELHQVLGDALGSDAIHTGHRCVDCVDDDEGARLVFETGESVAADLVVAADGVRSALREKRITTEQPVYSGATAFRGLAPIERVPSLPDPAQMHFWMGPGGHVVNYPVRGGKFINVLAVSRTPAWDHQAWMIECNPREAVQAFDGWHRAVAEMVGCVEGVRWALFDRRPLERWSDGRLVLLGDAAHAMLPHQGQGAAMTIEDAIVLADSLEGAGVDGIDDALTRYEEMRQERTRRVQGASRLAALFLHLPDGPEAEARDAKLPDLSDDFEWIHGFDAASTQSTPPRDGALSP